MKNSSFQNQQYDISTESPSCSSGDNKEDMGAYLKEGNQTTEPTSAAVGAVTTARVNSQSNTSESGVNNNDGRTGGSLQLAPPRSARRFNRLNLRIESGGNTAGGNDMQTASPIATRRSKMALKISAPSSPHRPPALQTSPFPAAKVKASRGQMPSLAIRVDNEQNMAAANSTGSSMRLSGESSPMPWQRRLTRPYRIDSPTAADIPPTPGSPPSEPINFFAMSKSFSNEAEEEEEPSPTTALGDGGVSAFGGSFKETSTAATASRFGERSGNLWQTNSPPPSPKAIPTGLALKMPLRPSFGQHRRVSISNDDAPPSPMGPPRLLIGSNSMIDSNTGEEEPCTPTTPTREFLEQNFSELHISSHNAWESQQQDAITEPGSSMQCSAPRRRRQLKIDINAMRDDDDDDNDVRDEQIPKQWKSMPSYCGKIQSRCHQNRSGRVQKQGKGLASIMSIELYRKPDRLPHKCFTTTLQSRFIQSLSPEQQAELLKQQKDFLELCEHVRRRARRRQDTSGGGGLSSNRLATRPLDTRVSEKKNVGKILDTCLHKRNMLMSRKSMRNANRMTRKEQLDLIRANTFFGRRHPKVRDSNQSVSASQQSH